jgi:quinol-cytochrome oxidoreductase complex cytochrome b subunit
VAVIGVHFWLIRHLGIQASGGGATTFRRHAIRLAGVSLLLYAAVGLLSVLAPEGVGYPPVAGMEVTKPFWPVLWIYGLENLLGMWGMVIGPAVLTAFLLCLPLVDRGEDAHPGIRGAAGWVGVALATAVLGFWLFGRFGVARAHLGM